MSKEEIKQKEIKKEIDAESTLLNSIGKDENASEDEELLQDFNVKFGIIK